MLVTRLFDCGPLFMTLSERRWPEIEQGMCSGLERFYTLDLSGINEEQQLLNGLLTAFELGSTKDNSLTSYDACLDHIRGALVLRPERSVLLALFNLGDLPDRSLQPFLHMVSLLTHLDVSIGHFVPSGPRHRVLLRVVFLGTGPNYPEEPEWASSTADPEQT
jgi:hypothetical protein